MMEQCLDPYEEQLYKVFSSHASANDGALDHTGLLQLCETLQLQDKSDDLITSLLGKQPRSRATFPQFKDALLRLLDNMQNMQNDKENQDCDRDKEKDKDKDKEKERDREVAPKYVVGTKKYGRRSRPRIDDSPISNHSNGIQRSNSTADHIRPPQAHGRLQRCTSVPSVTSYDETSFISASSLNMTEGCTEDMLREAWRKLGVGDDGYLNQSELILVFEAIGLDKLTENVIRHLSNNSVAVVDYKKRISFQELLEALQKDDTWSHFLGEDSSGSFILNSDERAANIKLGPDGSGYISQELITEMWESAGIASPKLLLKDLGFAPNVSVDVSELASILEKEIKSLSLSELRIDHTCNPLVALLQAFITIYQAEIKCLKSILQQVCDEKEKLKFDISEANNRSTLLAQEVDENVLKLEQKAEKQMKSIEARHAEVLRELTEQFTGEKEQMALSNQDLEEKIKTLECEELILRDNLQNVQNYLGVVEGENKELASKVFELEEVKVNLEQQIDELELEKLKVLELETMKSEELLDEIGALKRENGVLKDQNDEMLCQIEALNKEIALGRCAKAKTYEEPINLDGIGLGGKRRNGEATNDDYDFECAITGSPRLGKMRKFHEAREATALDTSFVDEVDGARRKHALVDSLLRKYAIKLDCNENSEENYTKMLEKLLGHMLSALNDDDALDFRAALTIEPIERTTFIIPRCTGRGDEPKPDDHDNENVNVSQNVHEDNNLEDYKEKLSSLEATNSALTEKCDGLQQGLTLLRDEYEMCEDYWQKKLEDERSIYEMEQAQSTEKLNEVLSRLTEYEEQFLEESRRLSTIDETQMEKQYTDLEAEYEEYKSRAIQDIEEQESLIVSLKDQLDSIKCQEVAKDVAVQVDDLRFMNLAYTKVHFDCYIPEPKLNNAPPSSISFEPTSSHNTTMPLKTKKNRRHVRSLTQPAWNLKRATSSDSDNASTKEAAGAETKTAAAAAAMHRMVEQRGHLERRCMELQSELKYHKRLYEQLFKSYNQLDHSWLGELQHAYAKLDQQFRLITKLQEKLAGNDVLVKNLYIENAYLIKNNQRLEQQLQMFANHPEVNHVNHF